MTAAGETRVLGYTGRSKHKGHVRYYDHPVHECVYVEVYRGRQSGDKRTGRPPMVVWYADPSWGSTVPYGTLAEAEVAAARMLDSWTQATDTGPERRIPQCRRVLAGDGK